MVEPETSKLELKETSPFTVRCFSIETFSLKDASARARISADEAKVTLLSNVVS